MNRACLVFPALMVAIGTGCALCAEAGPARTEERSRLAKGNTEALPHIRIDREKNYLDLEATVIPLDRLETWLELLACTKAGRDHESVLIIKARPSHVHLALLMMGLEPGSPMSWKVEDDRVRIEKLPSGPPIAVTAIYLQRDQVVEIPVNEWVVNQRTGEVLKDNVWVFAGSKFLEIEGRKVFLADLNGSVLTLVNFGDELLARPTAMTELNDEQSWVAVREKIPPADTAVTLRLRPLPPPDPDRESDQEKGGKP